MKLVRPSMRALLASATLLALSAGCSDARAVGSPQGVDAGGDVDLTSDRAVTGDALASPDASGVPCPGSIAGNGAPCDLVGDGCGGEPTCGVSYACSCNAVHRWQCVAMPSACDASVDAPTSACSLVGTYALLVNAIPYYLALRADGQWRLATTLEGLAASTMGGTYTVSGSQVSFVEPQRSVTRCTPGAMGTYAFTFSADCRTLRMAFVTEPCSDRATAFAGRPLVREGR